MTWQICMDGVGSSAEDRILVIGATNLPQELDEAVLRRLPKRVYIPLPDDATRQSIIAKNICKVSNNISARDMREIVRCVQCLPSSSSVMCASLTEGYSASDLTAVLREASFLPLRFATLRPHPSFSHFFTTASLATVLWVWMPGTSGRWACRTLRLPCAPSAPVCRPRWACCNDHVACADVVAEPRRLSEVEQGVWRWRGVMQPCNVCSGSTCMCTHVQCCRRVDVPGRRDPWAVWWEGRGGDM